MKGLKNTGALLLAALMVSMAWAPVGAGAVDETARAGLESGDEVLVLVNATGHQEELSAGPLSVPASTNQSVSVSVKANDEGAHAVVVFEGLVDERVEEEIRPGDVDQVVGDAEETVITVHDLAIGLCNQVVWQLGSFECARLV